MTNILDNISDSCRMSPGGFSLRLLVPVFLRRRSKKYEKLETEDPEKKKQEATLDELVRINFKIVSKHIKMYVRVKRMMVLYYI